MAWTDPITFVSGNVLTAAQMNVIQANLLAGGPTYATEAARNTAIPSPFEGQRAYITGSTETTAAGGVTAIPTGIQTIYNGSGWVTVTETGSFQSAAGTLGSSAYTATLGGSPGTNPSVTLRTGTTALIIITASISVAGTTTTGIDVAVSGASTIGAGTVAGQPLSWAQSATGLTQSVTCSIVMTTLTAGVNTFTLNYVNSTANVATFTSRRLIVKGIA